MSRTLRCSVTYAAAHSIMTTRRLRKPISSKMWRKSQASHASSPENLSPRISATADPRPMIAMLPRSSYECLRRLPLEPLQDGARGVHAALHWDLRDPRQRMAGRIRECRGVADDEGLRVTRHGEVAFDDDAPGAVARDLERRRDGRGGDAGRPQDRAGLEPLGTE